MDFTVRAEWEPLTAVRVHTPGLELWGGAVDPESNLFERPVPPDQSRREHERLVTVLESAGVAVHQLADDLATAGVLDDLVREHVTAPAEADLEATLATLDSHEKLQLALSRATFERSADAATGPAPRRRSPTSTSSATRPSSATAGRCCVPCTSPSAAPRFR